MVDPERNATDIDTVLVLQFSFSVYSRHTQVHIMAWNAHVYLVFFLQMSNTSRISTQNTHERLFSNDIHIKLA